MQTKDCASVLAATLAAIRMQKDAGPRCHIPLRLRRKQSVQKCWAALLASIVFLLPANLLPISVIYINGGRQEDTYPVGYYVARQQ
ncbi:Paraquat-inducible protein A [Salmonella enterica subsp. arizonae]|uniref:Paraquat-inducible protein A n=1 Tax=Salmonella enterica subsp. arizonae TaxID=59203 RepID=A0A379S1R0_SALER|nr:Paraquat-inducible protein A [Salmonella enterica subsp. arizonae]